MKKILVVDDDLGIREAIKAALKRSGCEIVTAKDSEEALGKLDETYQLVMSDLQMPGHDGVWLAKQIKDKYSGKIPVVIMTGALNEVKRCTKEAGVSSILPKPFECQDLFDTVLAYIK